jgi:glycerate kinase
LVDNLRVYGADKGVDADTAPCLSAIIESVGRLAAARGFDILENPWVGAGGGLAGGLHAFAGARVVPGASFVMRLAEFDKTLVAADHVFTTGGVLNTNTFRGKLPYAVAQAAAEHGIPSTLLTEVATTSPLPALPGNSRYAALGNADGDGVTVLRSLALAAARALSDALEPRSSP